MTPSDAIFLLQLLWRRKKKRGEKSATETEGRRILANSEYIRFYLILVEAGYTIPLPPRDYDPVSGQLIAKDSGNYHRIA